MVEHDGEDFILAQLVLIGDEDLANRCSNLQAELEDVVEELVLL